MFFFVNGLCPSKQVLIHVGTLSCPSGLKSEAVSFTDVTTLALVAVSFKIVFLLVKNKRFPFLVPLMS